MTAAVVNLAAWRQRRAGRLTATSRHPTVVGGPNCAHLMIVARDLVPAGYYAGLWQVGIGRVAHALRPEHDGWTDEVTRCGMAVLSSDRRRADTSLRPCRRCFPS